MLAKLSDYSFKNGIGSLGPPSGFYYNTPQDVAVNDLIWEVCYPIVLDTQEYTDKESKSGVKRISETRVATIIHEGSHRKTSASYKKLQSWIKTNNLDVCGPAEYVDQLRRFISLTLTKQMENKELRFGYLLVYPIFPVHNVFGTTD